MHEVPKADPIQAELLAGYRRATEPTDADVERALSRVLARIETEPARPGHGLPVWGWVAAAAMVLITLGLATWAVTAATSNERLGHHGEAEYQRVPAPTLESVAPDRHRPEPRAVVIEQPKPLAPSEAELPDAADPSSDAVAGSKRDRQRKRSEPPPIEPTPEPAPASDLAGESRLLSKARSALAAEDFDGAVDWADEHAKRYPDGLLTEERLTVESVALCRSGKLERGRTTLAELERRYPGAPTTAEIKRACAGD